MRLLAGTDYALRALMRLAVEPQRRLSTEVLARELGLSRHHLHKLVQALVECFRADGGACSLTP